MKHLINNYKLRMKKRDFTNFMTSTLTLTSTYEQQLTNNIPPN